MYHLVFGGLAVLVHFHDGGNFEFLVDDRLTHVLVQKSALCLRLLVS